MAGGKGKSLPPLALHLYTEARHRRQGDFNVGLGDQIAHHLYRGFYPGQRQRHQQTGQELARQIASYLQYATGTDRGRANRERWKILAPQIADICAELAQGVDKIANGAFMHPRHAGQRVVPTCKRQRRGERAKCRSGVAEKQLGLPARKFAGHAVHAIGAITQRLHDNAKQSQCIYHARCIVGLQKIANFSLSVGERGE